MNNNKKTHSQRETVLNYVCELENRKAKVNKVPAGMALGQGSAYPETGCFFSLVWKGPCNAMLFFGEHVSSWKGNLFPLFWIHVLLSPTRSQRKRTIWMPFGCVFLRLCSCQLCGLDSPGLCKLNHVFLGFYGIHPFPLPFPPSVLTFTSTSLTLGWINLIGAEREAGPPGLGRGLTGWAGGGVVEEALRSASGSGGLPRKVGLEEASEESGTLPAPEPDVVPGMWWQMNRDVELGAKMPKMNLPGWHERAKERWGHALGERQCRPARNTAANRNVLYPAFSLRNA